jgi:hypothetical protein
MSTGPTPPTPPPPPGPPAPVITDGGSYGRLPPAPPGPSRFEQRTTGVRSGTTWIAGVALALVIALWLTALSASQATDPVVALPVQERGVAVLTAVDDLLEVHQEEIGSAEVGESGGVAVPGFLVPGIELTAAEARSGDLELMHAGLLSRSATAIYEQGSEALQPPGGPLIETTMFSTPGGARRVMDLLNRSNHDRANRFVQPLAILAIILGGVVLALGQGFSRFTGLGVAMIAAGALVFLEALVLKFAVAFIGSDGSVVADEFMRLSDAVAWTPARNAIVLAAAGAVVLVPAWLLNWFFDRSLVRPTPVIDTPQTPSR